MPLEETLDRTFGVLRVVPLWRFEPGRRGSDAVAVKVRERMVFRIF